MLVKKILLLLGLLTLIGGSFWLWKSQGSGC
jgi:hypothetical protein